MLVKCSTSENIPSPHFFFFFETRSYYVSWTDSQSNSPSSSCGTLGLSAWASTLGAPFLNVLFFVHILCHPLPHPTPCRSRVECQSSISAPLCLGAFTRLHIFPFYIRIWGKYQAAEDPICVFPELLKGYSFVEPFPRLLRASIAAFTENRTLVTMAMLLVCPHAQPDCCPLCSNLHWYPVTSPVPNFWSLPCITYDLGDVSLKMPSLIFTHSASLKDVIIFIEI